MSLATDVCSGAEGVADRRLAQLASSAAPSSPPPTTTRPIQPDSAMARSLDSAPSPESAASSAGGFPPTPTSSVDSSGRCGIDSGIDAAALRWLDRAHGASGPPSRGTSPRAPRQRQDSTFLRPSSALDLPDISDAVNVSEHSDCDSLDGYMDDSDIAERLEEHLTALRDAAEEGEHPFDPTLGARRFLTPLPPTTPTTPCRSSRSPARGSVLRPLPIPTPPPPLLHGARSRRQHLMRRDSPSPARQRPAATLPCRRNSWCTTSLRRFLMARQTLLPPSLPALPPQTTAAPSHSGGVFRTLHKPPTTPQPHH
ncbi:uncharacterized protein LOC124545567 [Schistocerca americana]|uniref:uncharacterized protein LOC124545567 n=1 Tax=Schistocerca americana TaxID=7009 RepID=UPI001F500520|nr:uncharacterized protein LOC124545567 [Schistocerca americana]